MILCIDDEPTRYAELTKAYEGVVAVTCRQVDVRFYLSNYRHLIIGICLDHDMPWENGMWYADMLTSYSIPVVVTSHNPGGANNIVNLLSEYEVPVIKAPAQSGTHYAEKLVKYFKETANV